MDGIVVAFFVPIVIFLIVVVPIWLPLHYRYLSKSKGSMSDDDRELLSEVLAKAEAMADRIETLEKILDAEAPNWRQSDLAQEADELAQKDQMNGERPAV